MITPVPVPNPVFHRIAIALQSFGLHSYGAITIFRMQTIQPPLMRHRLRHSDSKQTLNIFAHQDWNDVLPFYFKDVKNRWDVGEQMVQLLMFRSRSAYNPLTLRFPNSSFKI